MMKIIHEEAPPLDEVPGAPPKLRGMIGKALEKNPERRYQRAAEFASELRDLQLSIERQLESSARRRPPTETVPAGQARGGPRREARGCAPRAQKASRGRRAQSWSPGAGRQAACSARRRWSRPRIRPDRRRCERPRRRRAISADALMMRSGGATVDSDDPLSDVMIGGREDSAIVGDRAQAVRTSSRPAWVPAGAAAAIIVASSWASS